MTENNEINEMNDNTSVVEQTENKKKEITLINDVKYTFIVYQMLICVVLLILIILFKLFGGRFYGYARQEYINTFEQNLSVKGIVRSVKGLFETEDSIVMSINPDLPLLLDTYVSKTKIDIERNNFVNLETSEDEIVENTLIWPVEGVISDEFGSRVNPFNNTKTDFHNGIDIAVPCNTPVKASMDGTVTISRFDRTYGNYIVITHSDFTKTVYAHMESRLVEASDVVHKGQTIGLSGNTGRSTGPHLHFEIIMGKTTRINPRSLLPDE